MLIKEQLKSKLHPLRKIIDEFFKSFLYINRHLLYHDKIKKEDPSTGKPQVIVSKNKLKEMRSSHASSPVMSQSARLRLTGGTDPRETELIDDKNERMHTEVDQLHSNDNAYTDLL